MVKEKTVLLAQSLKSATLRFSICNVQAQLRGLRAIASTVKNLL